MVHTKTRVQWSTEEDTHGRPGHHWLYEFGDGGNDTGCVKQFNLSYFTWEDHWETRFYNGDCTLVMKWWFHRVEEDTSELTFQEWTPDVDKSRSPVPMLINSSELWVLFHKKKSRGPPRKNRGPPRTMKLKTLFRPLMDHHDRRISQYSLQDVQHMIAFLPPHSFSRTTVCTLLYFHVNVFQKVISELMEILLKFWNRTLRF
jgi:hypothetical protein